MEGEEVERVYGGGALKLTVKTAQGAKPHVVIMVTQFNDTAKLLGTAVAVRSAEVVEKMREVINARAEAAGIEAVEYAEGTPGKDLLTSVQAGVIDLQAQNGAANSKSKAMTALLRDLLKIKVEEAGHAAKAAVAKRKEEQRVAAAQAAVTALVSSATGMGATQKEICEAMGIIPAKATAEEIVKALVAMADGPARALEGVQRLVEVLKKKTSSSEVGAKTAKHIAALNKQAAEVLAVASPTTTGAAAKLAMGAIRDAVGALADQYTSPAGEGATLQAVPLSDIKEAVAGMIEGFPKSGVGVQQALVDQRMLDLSSEDKETMAVVLRVLVEDPTQVVTGLSSTFAAHAAMVTLQGPFKGVPALTTLHDYLNDTVIKAKAPQLDTQGKVDDLVEAWEREVLAMENRARDSLGLETSSTAGAQTMLARALGARMLNMIRRSGARVAGGVQPAFTKRLVEGTEMPPVVTSAPAGYLAFMALTAMAGGCALSDITRDMSTAIITGTLFPVHAQLPKPAVSGTAGGGAGGGGGKTPAALAAENAQLRQQLQKRQRQEEGGASSGSAGKKNKKKKGRGGAARADSEDDDAEGVTPPDEGVGAEGTGSDGR